MNLFDPPAVWPSSLVAPAGSAALLRWSSPTPADWRRPAARRSSPKSLARLSAGPEVAPHPRRRRRYGRPRGGEKRLPRNVRPLDMMVDAAATEPSRPARWTRRTGTASWTRTSPGCCELSGVRREIGSDGPHHRDCLAPSFVGLFEAAPHHQQGRRRRVDPRWRSNGCRGVMVNAIAPGVFRTHAQFGAAGFAAGQSS